MGREIAVVVAKAMQVVAKQAKVIRLLGGHLEPVGVEIRRQTLETIDRIQGQIDGCELDVGEGMDQGGVPLRMGELAARQALRRYEEWTGGAAGFMHGFRVSPGGGLELSSLPLRP